MGLLSSFILQAGGVFDDPPVEEGEGERDAEARADRRPVFRALGQVAARQQAPPVRIAVGPDRHNGFGGEPCPEHQGQTLAPREAGIL